MPLTGLEDLNITTADQILTFPLIDAPYFWGTILFFLFWIFTFLTYFEEKDRVGRANFLSSLAVSSLVIIVLAFAGSLFGAITNEIMGIILTVGLIIIFVWFIKKD